MTIKEFMNELRELTKTTLIDGITPAYQAMYDEGKIRIIGPDKKSYCPITAVYHNMEGRSYHDTRAYGVGFDLGLKCEDVELILKESDCWYDPGKVREEMLNILSLEEDESLFVEEYYKGKKDK